MKVVVPAVLLLILILVVMSLVGGAFGSHTIDNRVAVSPVFDTLPASTIMAGHFDISSSLGIDGGDVLVIIGSFCKKLTGGTESAHFSARADYQWVSYSLGENGINGTNVCLEKK